MDALLHIGSWQALISFASLFAASAAGALLSAIWEGTILAVGGFVCLRLFPGLSAAARSVVWMNVFLLLVLLHVLPAIGAHVSTGSARSSAPFELDAMWSYGIGGVWAALSLFRAVQLLFSAVRLRQLASWATPVTPAAAMQALLQIRSRRGKAVRSAELCTSTEVQRPSVFGFFHSRILLPPALLERLTPAELEQVVIHEMEHLRRADDWTNLLQKLALVLFPLNPALLWVERRLCAERELACDDSVLRSKAGRKAYAVCLTRLAEHSMLRRSFSLVLGAWERQSELVQRVHRILRRPAESMSHKQTMALTGSLIAGVLACALGLARSPQLVGFAEPAPSVMPAMTQTSLLAPGGDPVETKLQHPGPPAYAEMVKAILPARTLPSASLTSASMATPSSTAKPIEKNAALHGRRRRPASRQQEWFLMTAWSDSEAAPQLVLTIAPGDRTPGKQIPGTQSQEHRVSYAAVPIPYGWLIIQI